MKKSKKHGGSEYPDAFNFFTSTKDLDKIQKEYDTFLQGYKVACASKSKVNAIGQTLGTREKCDDTKYPIPKVKVALLLKASLDNITQDKLVTILLNVEAIIDTWQ